MAECQRPVRDIPRNALLGGDFVVYVGRNAVLRLMGLRNDEGVVPEVYFERFLPAARVRRALSLGRRLCAALVFMFDARILADCDEGSCALAGRVSVLRDLDLVTGLRLTFDVIGVSFDRTRRGPEDDVRLVFLVYVMDEVRRLLRVMSNLNYVPMLVVYVRDEEVAAFCAFFA